MPYTTQQMRAIAARMRAEGKGSQAIGDFFDRHQGKPAGRKADVKEQAVRHAAEARARKRWGKAPAGAKFKPAPGQAAAGVRG